MFPLLSGLKRCRFLKCSRRETVKPLLKYGQVSTAVENMAECTAEVTEKASSSISLGEEE